MKSPIRTPDCTWGLFQGQGEINEGADNGNASYWVKCLFK